jgi:hypothetical protein
LRTNLESFTVSREFVDDTDTPNSTPLFFDMSSLSTDADAPDRTVTPDQMSPAVMLFAVTKELDIASPDKDPVTEKASFSLLMLSTVTPMAVCDPADDVAVMLSNALFRTVES